MCLKKYLLLLVVLLSFFKVSAQLCQGSLGDPIVDITFGSGPNPGPPLTITNMNYISSDCPDDGSYTIRNTTSQCFGNTWHSFTDHTGDPNGYFMLINASFAPSQFYLDTVRGLCPNTTYEFAAWIMNIILPTSCNGNTIRPNLTFNIESTDGVVLNTYSTGNIDPSSMPIWKQYGFFFTTPPAAQNVVLRIKNNSIGGCGNDIAIDDITFRPCGAKLTPSIVGIPVLVKELCAGEDADVLLNCDVSAGYSNPLFQWQQSSDGSTWTDIAGANGATYVKHIFSNSPAGDYLYRITAGESANGRLPACRVASAVLTIRVHPIPTVSILNNSPVCERSLISLTATGGNQYLWTGVNAFSFSGNPVTIQNAKLSDAGKYYVNVTDTFGCKNADSLVVSVKPAPVASAGADRTTICSGDSVSLTSSGGLYYLWSPVSGLSSASISNPVARPSDTTRYVVTVSNAAACTDSASVTVNVIHKPIANAGPDQVLVEGQSVQLAGSASGNVAGISWFPTTAISDVHSLKPIVNPVITTDYILTVMSNNGCGSSSDTVNVRVFKKVIIPNAFSPNGDGVNDTWIITALNSYDEYELSVFNRYGVKVFETKNYSRPWNGTYNDKPLPVGTYYYLLDLKQSFLPRMTGYVVILR